jgi:hypothetical protein
LREIEQQLPPFPEYPSQQPRHGEDDVAVRDGLELVKDPRPQEAQLEPPEPRPLLADIPESLGSYDGQR